ncbi:MAG: AsmA-like C-terminal region-containing protein [Verrucomicrobiae bacterium]|nr:AsmA-like C-terminal region-containing protein [Verrucomicrobiae bacterium]
MAGAESISATRRRISRWRRAWRVCRLSALLAALALVLAVLYLNRIGLPEFLRRPLLDRLRARGLALEVSRLRLSFHRGIVAEGVQLARGEGAAAPGRAQTGVRLDARSADLNLRWAALLSRRVEVTGVVLRQGRLVWTLAGPGAAPRELAADDLHGTLRLLPGDEWALDDFRARFAGARFTVSGLITNASAWRTSATPGPAADAQARQRRWQRFAETLERIQFTTAPELRLMVRGDARDPRSFTVRLTLDAPDARTPWGELAGARLSTHVAPPGSDAPHQAEVRLAAQRARTPWATVTNLEVLLTLAAPNGLADHVHGSLLASADLLATRWGELTRPQVRVAWQHAVTNPIPLSGRGELRAATATTPWLAGNDFRLNATLEPATATGALATAPGPWAWLTNLEPYALGWKCELARPNPSAAPRLEVEHVTLSGRWRAPELALTHLRAAFPEGDLVAEARLDAVTRALQFELQSDFDPQRLLPWLPEKPRERLARFSWATPPRLSARGTLVLPAWTNRSPDWRAEVQPTLELAGEFELTHAAYLGVPAQRARGHFFYTNQLWWLPDLEVLRPEGTLRLEHVASDATRDFFWRVEGVFDPRAVRPLLKPGDADDLDLLSCRAAPVFTGEIRGRWQERERLGFHGRVALTNFSVRGEHADWFTATLQYTNRALDLLEPRLGRGAETLTAEGIRVDWPGDRIWFTNGLSTTDPMVVARAIGPQVARAIEPYRWAAPPRVRVNGYAPLHGSENADVQFEIEGGPFAWWKLCAPRIAGVAHWRGETVTLTNVQMDFYGGQAAGFAALDFTPARGAAFAFTAGFTNAALARLLADLAARTNRLEGDLTGWVEARGNTDDPRTWTGQGRARLRDGFLWELPIFGVLSGPLDFILPGVANSRFTEASARFTLTNGLVVWDKLEMRAPALRLQYAGTVDWDGRVDMRVEAEPLRDAPLVGRLFSFALWPVSKLFQYRITGTLAEPKTEPTYVPKWFFFPLHPFRTLGELLAPDADRTNAPPAQSRP